MRKTVMAVLSVLALASVTGCGNEYLEKIDQLDTRADELLAVCGELNANIEAIQAIVTVLQGYDLITGVTSLTESSETVGYKINFAKHSSVSIYNGANGDSPLVTSRKEDGTYYWAIQYGSGDWDWILDAEGNRIPSIGKRPYFRVNESTGMWEMSFDYSTWTEVGKAVGDQGDSLFADVDLSNPDYVVFTLADGTVMKVPAFSAYQAALADIGRVSDNVSALKLLVSAMDSSFVYVRTVEPLVNGADTVGMTVALSNGKGFTIHNFTSTNVPEIWSELDTLDNRHYWVIQYGDEPVEWILDGDGNRVVSEDVTVEAPAVGMALAEDGYYYWTVSYASDTTMWLGLDEGVHALDSVRNTIFSKVVNDVDFLTVTLKDSTSYSLPKMFSVALSAADTLHTFVNDTLSMFSVPEAEKDIESVGDTAYLCYTAYGSSATDLTLIAQGGFAAREVSDGRIMVVAPSFFGDGRGKVVALFSLDGSGSTKTVCKTILIGRKERMEE